MALTLVGSITAVGDSGATTAAIDTTGANLLVISASWVGFGSDSVSDSKGNTWVPLTQHASGTKKHQFFYCLTPTVGTGHTFTVSGGGFPAAIVYAFSGAASYHAENGNAVFSPGASGTVTPSANGALVLTGRVDANATTTTGITPAGFT